MAFKFSLSGTSDNTQKRSASWDPQMQSIVDTEVGARITREVAIKKEIRRARLLFEASAQSQSPSKDFVALLITEKGIIWSKWKVTLRGYTSGGAPVPQPQEEVMSFTDFKCNDSLLDEVKRCFGESTLQHIERIISGSNDVLSCTPEPLMIRICELLDLQTITQLSQVNRHLRKLCMCDKLWSSLYQQYQGTPSLEICALAGEVSWRKVFYMNKLQLQKELSRRRKLTTSPSAQSTPSERQASCQSSGNATSAFLTDHH